MSTTTELELPASKLVKSQRKIYGPKFYKEHGNDMKIVAHVRYDDQCGNGHNTFSITGETWRKSGARWIEDCGGCIHEEVAKRFPELAPFIKWHLVYSDGPMHYPGNVLYMAGERDCWGCLKGEVRTWTVKIKHGQFPMLFNYESKFVKWLQEVGRKFVEDCEVLPIEHRNIERTNYKLDPKYTLGAFDVAWHECPFDSEADALNFIQAVKEFGVEFVRVPSSYGEGKERELNAARSCAVWPEATDEELTAPDLKERLLARLPALMEEFKRDVESLGFTY